MWSLKLSGNLIFRTSKPRVEYLAGSGAAPGRKMATLPWLSGDFAPLQSKERMRNFSFGSGRFA